MPWSKTGGAQKCPSKSAPSKDPLVERTLFFEEVMISHRKHPLQQPSPFLIPCTGCSCRLEGCLYQSVVQRNWGRAGRGARCTVRAGAGGYSRHCPARCFSPASTAKRDQYVIGIACLRQCNHRCKHALLEEGLSGWARPDGNSPIHSRQAKPFSTALTPPIFELLYFVGRVSTLFILRSGGGEPMHSSLAQTFLT
jgi:hypothetical protein